MDFFQEWQEALGIKPMAFEWESFQWGMLAGAIITVAVGGVALYFVWPYILSGMKTVPVFKEIAEEIKKAVG
ncbi:MAG: hypothetical protein ACP5KV_07690 [Candidatus Methanomethylicaceae archaeon]